MGRSKKYLGVLALTLVLSLVACSSAASTETTDDSSGAETEDGTSYTGTVSAISTTSISITTDDGEELEFTLTDDTEYVMDMGDGADISDIEEPDGEAPSGDGEPAGGEMGDAPDGDAGEMPEGEVGEATDAEGEEPSGEAPSDDDEMPDGEMGEAPDTEDGEEPSGEAPSGDGDMPDGETGEAPDGDAGEIPEGEMGDAPDGDAGEMPDGQAPSSDEGGRGGMGAGDAELTYESISIGDEVTITADDDGNAVTVTISIDMSDGMGGGSAGGGDVSGGSSSGVDSYDAVNEYTEDTEVSDTTIESTGTDENAVLVQTSGITVELEDVTIVRDSDDSTGGDNSSFYGVGAAALVADGTLIIEDSVIESNAAGGAGVFAYGDGTAYVEDTVITTVQDTSGGVHVAGGGTLYAWDLTVETSGESSAAIRSDRGSGTMVVDGGTYTTNWTGSPAVYSTADITVNDAVLTANSSEAVCIEGLNTIRLFDCDVTGSMQDLDTNDCTWTVILYQSMSGDSEVGNSTFEMVGGSLTSANGGMFYTTNTESTFVISDVDLTYSDDSEFLLKVTGNSNSRGWGTAGANGADCSFTAVDQELEGAVIWDSISTLDMYLSGDSTLTGYFENDETNAGDGGDGYANLYIDADSTWVVTGDSVLSELQCEGTIAGADGGTVTIVGTDGSTYVEGTGSYTITVDSYSGSADLSGASEVESWADYEVDEP